MASGAELAMILRAKDEASRTFDHVKSSASGMASGVSGAVGGLVSGFGALGLAAQGVQAAFGAVQGIGNAFGIGALSEMEQVRASINAFTKDGEQTTRILEQVRDRASKTPFAFGEMAKATQALLPISKSTGQGLMDLVAQAEILAASNPMEGLEGASFALKEAMTGDFTSIIERFNLSRQSINQWKSEGVSNFEIVRRAMAEMGLDADLVAAQGETLAGRWSTFQDTMQTLQMTVGQPIFDVLKESLVGMQGALDSNMPAIQAFAELLAGGISSAIETAKGALTGLMDLWTDLGTGFRDGGLIGVLEELGPQLRAILENLGSLIASTVEQWATDFAAWVDGAEGMQGSKLAEMAQGLLAWIIDTAAAIIEKLGVWAAAFVDWIGPKIPGMLAELGGYLSSMAGWMLGTALPMILGKLAEWGLAFIEWVIPRIPGLLAALGQLLADLGGWIIGTALPAVQAKNAELGQAFIAWVADVVLPRLPGALLQIQVAMLNFIASAAGAVLSAAASIGTNIVQGVVNGIQNAAGRIGEALGSIARQALERAQAFIESRSPSKLFERELGMPIGEGVAAGISATQRTVSGALTGLVQPPSLAMATAGGGFGGGGFGGGGSQTLEINFRVDDVLAERIVIRGERMRSRRVRVDRRS